MASRAARGLDLRAPMRPAAATGAVLAQIRESVGGPGPDRFVAPDIEAVVELVRSGALRDAAQASAGMLL